MAKAWKAIIATFIAALGPFSFGYQLPYTSEALLDLQSDAVDSSIHLSDAQGTWFSSLLAVGAIFGSILGGWTIDHLGRKGTIMVCVLPFELGSLLIAFAQNQMMLYSGRVINGMACGMVSLAVPVYIAEIVPARLRGMLGSVNQLAVTLGILSSYVMGALVHWQWLALFGAIPPALQVVFMFSMPETPRWSLEKNRRNEALIALQWLRGPDADNEKECDTIVDSFDHNENLKWLDFLSPVILKPLVISIGLMVIQQFCGVNAVIFNAASIFKDAGFDKAKLVSISVGLIQFVGTALACLLMDRAGRRILLWTMALAMCITLAGLGLYFEIYKAPNGTDSTPASDTVSLVGSISHSVQASKISWLSILCLVLFNLAYAVAWGPIPWLVMSEIFPLKARGPASSLATLSNWLLAFVITKTYNSLVSGLTIQGTFWFYSGFSLLGFVFVFFVVPETKGKTLEEIEAMFHTGKHAYLRIE
ncbi:PREDICTED: solute carrier family 2, facilitated glucose transporter member 8-like [Acropora digitifera]|uniref:solute carrier family 2, facilitated glucose transporter member 8-like n=1 Tax=Acropora digitifera TaxID=70779 RepID=UPI00077AACD9|nr:PREDICTED: solute carrier family 2, facilitated glucose transporter member 8-like [Acropora digitifera]